MPVGDPFADAVLVGPLINAKSYEAMTDALAQAEAAGGAVVAGGERVDQGHPDAYYVRPAIVRMPEQADVVHRETFAPILYVMTYTTFEEAVELHNAVPQGLSSSIFTPTSGRPSGSWPPTAPTAGSSTSTSAPPAPRSAARSVARRRTGGGRESGSDAWRGYMRRATNTVNYSARTAPGPGGRLLLTVASSRQRRQPGEFGRDYAVKSTGLAG